MIDSYKFGQIVIDGKKYDHDVIVFGDMILSELCRQMFRCAVIGINRYEI